MNESDIKRPIGISILAGLHIIGSIIVAVIFLLYIPLLQNRPEFNKVVPLLGISPATLFIVIGFVLALACASGIGMWMGKKWGWFLGSFYYAYFIITNINALIMIPVIFETFGDEGPHGPPGSPRPPGSVGRRWRLSRRKRPRRPEARRRRR